MPGPFRSRSTTPRKSRSTSSTHSRNQHLNAISRTRLNPMRGRTRARKRGRTRGRTPLGQPSINRTTLQLRTENLPFLPTHNTNHRIYESRDFATRRRGTRYRGMNRSIANYNIRNLRRRGEYPTGEYREIPNPTSYSRRPMSVERRARRIYPVRAVLANRDNNGTLRQDYDLWLQEHGY